MLKVYTITKRILTNISKKQKLLQCYDCTKRFDLGSLVVSTTYGNSCKLRCTKCAVKYGIVTRKKITEIFERTFGPLQTDYNQLDMHEENSLIIPTHTR
jgi:hypothetical protein